MKRLFFLSLALAMALAMGMGGMGVVAADEANETNETTAEASETYEQRIDSTTKITDWSYSGGRFTIVFEADEPTTVSMTEAGSFEEGTSTFNYDEQRLQEGENVITFAVADRSGAAVAVATQESLSQGSGAIVSTGAVEENPFRHFGGESGLFSGVILTVAMSALGAWYVVRSEESGVMEA